MQFRLDYALSREQKNKSGGEYLLTILVAMLSSFLHNQTLLLEGHG